MTESLMPETLLHSLNGKSAVAILVGAILLAVVTSLLGHRSPAAEREAPPKRGSVWAAFLAVGAVAAAFVFVHGKTSPHAPAAAPKPAPAPTHTEVIHQVTKAVAASPLNGVEITIIAVVLAGTCIAIWVNRQRSA